MNKDLANKINDCSRLKGSFVLRSGNTSDVYFDKYQFESDPRLLDEITEELKKIISPNVEVLAGLEMGGIPLVTLLGQKMNLPIAFIRKETKKYGTCKYAEGADLIGKKVVLVEDIVSSGGALVNAIDRLESDNINIIQAVCVIDRQTGGKEALDKKEISFVSIFIHSDLENCGK